MPTRQCNQCGVGLVCSTWKSKESATVCALVAPIVLSRVMLSMHLSVRWTINPVGHYDMCKLLVQYTVEPPNKGHYGANNLVICREVSPISEVK